MDFYASIIDDYDAMVRFPQRVETEGTVMRRWIDRFGFDRVLDTACGTGLHAVVLARAGIAVTAADISAKMLGKAVSNAVEYGVSFTTAETPMQRVAETCPGPYGAVLCLGNSLPHLLSTDDLERSFAQFRSVLAPGGVMGIQLLNYDRVLARRERIVGIHRSGNTEFIRFYDFLDTTVRFNLLTVEWDGDAVRRKLDSTTLYPYRSAELVAALGRCGFDGIQCFGSMMFEPYDPAASGNLVITAHPA